MSVSTAAKDMDLSRPADEEKRSASAENKDDSSWIAEVSHELRLPIANLRLLVDTLLDGAIEDPEVCRRMITRAGQEVDRLQKLVVNLLSAEQASSSIYELGCQWLPLEERARYAAETTRTMAVAKNIAVEVAVDDDWKIYANPEQLDQVILNLVENAVKFTATGGKVWIKSGTVAGSFMVVDNGIGIAAPEIPKIFKRFYRVDRAQSRGSTGLGLSIVKHIADLHGAKINVTSEEGRGSTFEVEFPGPSG